MTKEIIISDAGNLAIGFAENLRHLLVVEKYIKEQKEEATEALLKAMEEHGIIKIENDLVSVRYVAESDSEYVDVKAMREELPEVVDAYTSIRPRKASLRFKVV